MVTLINNPVYLLNGRLVNENQAGLTEKQKTEAKCGSMAYKILKNHSKIENAALKIKFDALASHDITYVGIIQTAKASGLKEFPVPYVLTNCHNSLCAVGGTINEDDHVFGLSCAVKYGGEFVPPHIAVIHQYMREMHCAAGSMILGSDSHTRYGALGTMGIGEGGPELAKQLLSKTYDIEMPKIIAVYLKGNLRGGVGPQDVALALIGSVFKNSFVKNAVLEFAGEGIKNLSVDFRNGIDVMTTETTCLSSIWQTDEKVKEYYEIHGRGFAYKELKPAMAAYYSGAVVIDLDKIEPMIALPFHPSNVYKISELVVNPYDILSKTENEGRELLKNNNFSLTDKVTKKGFSVAQAVIAGCAGGMYENIAAAANIINKKGLGSGEFALNIYPSSQPVYKALLDNGYIGNLMESGAVVKTAFCGPCFGAGDVPYNNSISIRHTTRNFENREGSNPAGGQTAGVALMDARSIAATAANGGILTSALGMDCDTNIKRYSFNSNIYKNRVYAGALKPRPESNLKYGPNIADWPEIPALPQDLILQAASVLTDPVTTTDELIPSGETSSYRSNPFKLAEYTLSRKDKDYVARAKAIAAAEEFRRKNGSFSKKFKEIFDYFNIDISKSGLASVVVAVKPGDGSAREQAASCQRVLGGGANICKEYATKRYRSNLINWGMIPFTCKDLQFKVDDLIYIKNIRGKIKNGDKEIEADLISEGKKRNIVLSLDVLTEDEKEIILSGCLMNYYKRN